MFEGLYLHIPFCKQRCAYCDFTTEALPQTSENMDFYLEDLIKEVRHHTRSGELGGIRTIYIGGGTPTHFGHKRLVELGYTLSLSIRLEQVEEYTLEANPESLNPKLVKDMFALGVDRLSLGVQSFVDDELQALGRAHTAARAEQAFNEARERFENISLDLMCGIPGQTPESWQHSLELALALGPEHLSIYPLQLEEGTPFHQAVTAGELEEPDEDLQAQMMQQAASVIKKAGYQRYEVASYAKPGKESRHNSSYWKGSPYLGLGTGASSMKNLDNGSRMRTRTGDAPEILSPREALAEDLMLGMRMSAGITEQQLEQAAHLLPHAKDTFDELASLGLVTHAQRSYLPTEKGWLLGNELYLRIWELAST